MLGMDLIAFLLSFYSFDFHRMNLYYSFNKKYSLRRNKVITEKSSPTGKNVFLCLKKKKVQQMAIKFLNNVPLTGD